MWKLYDYLLTKLITNHFKVLNDLNRTLLENKNS